MWMKVSGLLRVTANLRYVHTYTFKMDKAYLRHALGSQNFEITFKYENPELKVDRRFNFSRQINEPVSAFLQRVSVNVEKATVKKNKKKMKKNPEEGNSSNSSTASVRLVMDDVDVCTDRTCSDIFKEGNKVLLKVNDATYEVLFNSPWVETLTLPSSMLAGFPVYPLKLDTLFTDRTISEFTWYKSLDKMNWSLVGSGFTYTPTNNDINHYLKLAFLPRKGLLEGPITEAVSDPKVEASPGLCPFETRHSFTAHKCCGRVVRMVSYNILADLYCDSDYTRTVLFPYCPPYALAIDYRKQLILKEIIGYQGDILCLQEVDKKVYTYDLEPVLSNLDYESDFALKGGLVAEGLACFYDKRRFRLLECAAFELSKHLETAPALAEMWKAVSQNQQLAERVLDRSTVLQVLLLESIENKNELFLVGNTHLYFHPDADHIRLLQGGMCIKLIEHIYNDFKKKYVDSRISLVFCGDLNSSPDCGIYKLLTAGYVSEDFKDWNSNVEESVKGLSLSQPFNMASACGIPQYTNFTAGFKDCLDWIYYDTKAFEVEQVVPFPSFEEMSQHIALPSVVFPSDHVALISDLKLL